MHDISALTGILLALSIGAASPGPSFVMVARTAASQGRKAGVLAALGMGVGGLMFAVASLLGLNALFLAVPVLYIGFKVVGGLYLAWLGLRIWRGASQPLQMESLAAAPGRASRSFWLGLMTQLSNPKTAIVYASVFAAFMPAAPSMGFDGAVAGLVFLIEAGWYTVVAGLLSASAPRNSYLRYKKWVDRCAGGIMTVLGLKLATSIHR